jgi:hypothetical protein
MRWYATPSPAVLPDAGAGRENLFGVRDLHGLVWEWTSDFNSALVTGDARGDTGLERQLFCGAGSLSARDQFAHSNLLTLLNAEGEIAFQHTGLGQEPAALVAAVAKAASVALR